MKALIGLAVWKKAIQFVTIIYEITQNVPIEKMYTLSNQMRRAEISIPSNIAEEAAQKSNKEYVQFLGSSVELDTQLIISYNLGYVNDKKIITWQQQLDAIGKMLNGLFTYRQNNPQPPVPK